ncbi:hypothetical protein Bbelb_331440 [Branchiostoma belcheri]|nr:hypothetical protein Bbelb_331440 [Branchiostoma belcheri]
MSDFDFNSWTATSKLTPATTRALVENDLAEKDALLCTTPEMLKELGLTVGQYALLCRATARLQAAGPAATAAREDFTSGSADREQDQDPADLGQADGTEELPNPSPEQDAENLQSARSSIMNNSNPTYSPNDEHVGESCTERTNLGTLYTENSADSEGTEAEGNIAPNDTNGSQLGTVSGGGGAPDENSHDGIEPYAVAYGYGNEGHRTNSASESPQPTGAPEQRSPKTNRQDALRPNPMYRVRAQQAIEGCPIVYQCRLCFALLGFAVLLGMIAAGCTLGPNNQDIPTLNLKLSAGRVAYLQSARLRTKSLVYRYMVYRYMVYRYMVYRYMVYRYMVYRYMVSPTEDRITFGGEGTEPGKFAGSKLSGRPLAVSPSNEMFIVDHGNRRVQVFDLKGGFLRDFSTGDWNPTALCLARNGDVWVLVWPRRVLKPEADRPQAHKYSKDGRALVRIKLEPVQGTANTIVADTLSDNIIVLWYICHFRTKDNNCAVLVFRPDGTLVRKFGDMNKPISLTLDKEGNIFVLEDRRLSIHKYNKDGRLLSVFQKRPSGTGYLEYPRDVCADDLGHLIVTDARTKSIQMFTGYGDYIRTIASISSTKKH